MTIAITEAAPARPAASFSPLQSIPFLCAIGLGLTLALSWPSAVAVWRTGAFANTDDAMRLVEVRDWLAGQAWFDLHQYRLDPPGGVFMHWTRVLDLPLGALIRLFALFAPMESAERLARIVFPFALHLGLFAAVAGLARKLAGSAAMLPAVVIMAMTGGVLVQFQPGRIHHHSAQILLVVLILRATIDAIDARRFWPATIPAALAALSLSINIENLTYVLAEIAAFAAAFIVLGERFRIALLGFGLALALASLAIFAATVGATRWFVGACDAFSSAHLTAIFVGAAAFVALAAATPRLAHVAMRLAGCALAGGLVIGVIALAYPACLHDPQAGVDLLLRKLWLEHVEEARPLMAIVAAHPLKFVTLALAAALGLAGAGAAAWFETGAMRARWLVVSAFGAIGFVTALWQVRALSSASAVAIFGGVWVIARLIGWAAERDTLAKLAPFAAALPFCSVFWALATPAQAESDAATGRVVCRAPAAIGALDKLPPSRLLAPIDMGSDILAQTRHSVLAAPYHRNNHGNRLLIDAMTAEPETARAIVKESGASYVVFCPAMPELEIYAAESPHGLAASLLAGKAPDWLALAPAPVEGSPLHIYQVR